jgi:hypothetical protein
LTDTAQNVASSSELSNASIEDAAKSFEALLSAETAGKRKPSKQPAAETAPEPIADDVDDDADALEAQADETEPEADEAPDDEAETSPEATEDDAEDSAAEEPLYTVKINGKDEQVPLSELLSGYSRTSDYHHKTQALANERRQFAAEIEQVKQERAQYSQLLPALAQQIQSAMPQPPSPSLIRDDPVAYLEQKEAYEQSLARLNAAAQEAQRVKSMQTEEQQRQAAQMVASAREKLPELIPAWKDPKAYERDRPAMRSYLGKIGYSDEEIDQAYDPRAVALAWKAMRYDELTSKKLTQRPAPVEKQFRPAPAAPAPAPRQTERRAFREAKNRLAQTGRIDDAAAALRSLL